MTNLIFERIPACVRRIAVVGHVRPDGDCAGSVTAVYRYLRNLYPEREIVPFLGEYEESLGFLAEGIPVRTDDGEGLFADLCIGLDISAPERIGAGSRAFSEAARTLVIDHHETNPCFGDENVVCPDASSTCEVLYTRMDSGKITQETAVSLYTGMVHDSGAFRYSCTGPETLRAAAGLLEKGVPFSRIIEDSMELKSYAVQKLTAAVLLRSRLYAEEKCLVSDCPLELLDRFEVPLREIGSVVTVLNDTREAEVTLFLYEAEPGVWKGSLRSRRDVNVARLAAVYGGGGHAKAAGFSFAGDCRDAEEGILEALRESSH